MFSCFLIVIHLQRLRHYSEPIKKMVYKIKELGKRINDLSGYVHILYSLSVGLILITEFCLLVVIYGYWDAYMDTCRYQEV